MPTVNPKVDFYFAKEKWNAELASLRKIVLACNLAEELKWGVPCYTYDQANIVLIHVFKDYCALLFFKGALLADPEGLLFQQTKNVQAARQLRFTHVKEIMKLDRVISRYIYEAIEAEKAGLKVTMKKTEEFEMPEEFISRLQRSKALKNAFEALTPGRQRAYCLFFSAAKQSTTRAARVEKYVDAILNGKGLND